MIRTMNARFWIVGILLAAAILPAFVSAQSSCERGGTCLGDTRSQTSQGGFVPLTKGADFQKMFGVSGSGGSAGDLTTFLNSGFKMVLSIGAIMAVLRIAWAGYQYMSSDAWGEKSHAKEILGDVVIGLLLLLGSYLILYQINPDILNLKINGVTPSGQTSAQQLVGGTQPL